MTYLDGLGRIGRVGCLFAPGWGSCGRSKTPWPFVQAHEIAHLRYVPFYEDDYPDGVFVLCVRCNEDLVCAEERLPFYREAWESYWYDTYPWEAVEEAVLDEER